MNQMNKGVVHGTILSVNDNTFWYLACLKCNRKVKNDSSCSTCGYPASTLRYRLSLELETQYGIVDMTVFGNCLEKYFGVDATDFNREFLCCNQFFKENANHLFKCVQTSFIGGFYKYVIENYHHLKRLEKQKHNNDHKQQHYVAEVMERVWIDLVQPTVYDVYRGKRESTNLKCTMVHHADGSLSTPVPALNSIHETNTCEEYSFCANFLKSDHLSGGFNQATNKVKEISAIDSVDSLNFPPNLESKQQSDNVAFLQDSFIVNLFQEHECSLPEYQHFTNNSRQEDSNLLSDNSTDIPMRQEDCFDGNHVYPSLPSNRKRTRHDLSFCNLSCLGTDERNHSEIDSSISCDLLDDVTLPVLPESNEREKKKMRFYSPGEFLKLRRSTSLLSKGESYLHTAMRSTDVSLVGERSTHETSMLAGLDLCMFSDSFVLNNNSECAKLSHRLPPTHQTSPNYSTRNNQNTQYTNSSFIPFKVDAEKENHVKSCPLRSPSNVAFPVSSSTPKRSPLALLNRHQTNTSSLQQSPSFQSKLKRVDCLSQDLFNFSIKDTSKRHSDRSNVFTHVQENNPGYIQPADSSSVLCNSVDMFMEFVT